jgi:hypothetical protein
LRERRVEKAMLGVDEIEIARETGDEETRMGYADRP